MRPGTWVLGVGLVLAAVVLAAMHAGADGFIADRLTRASDLIESQPKDPRGYWLRADLRREGGDHAGSLVDLERAERLDPNRPITAILRARVSLDIGHAAAALQILQPVVAKSDAPARAHRFYAEALLLLDQPARSAAAFSRAIESTSAPSPSLYLSRARAFRAAGDAYLDESLGGLDEGMDRLGPIVTLAREAIEIEVASERFERALERLSTASAGARRMEVWLEWRGRILDKAGRSEEAREAYTRAQIELSRAPAGQRSSPAMRKLAVSLQQALAERSVVRR